VTGGDSGADDHVGLIVLAAVIALLVLVIIILAVVIYRLRRDKRSPTTDGL